MRKTERFRSVLFARRKFYASHEANIRLFKTPLINSAMRTNRTQTRLYLDLAARLKAISTCIPSIKEFTLNRTKISIPFAISISTRSTLCPFFVIVRNFKPLSGNYFDFQDNRRRKSLLWILDPHSWKSCHQHFILSYLARVWEKKRDTLYGLLRWFLIQLHAVYLSR